MQQTVQFSVYKSSSSNIDKAEKDVRKVVNDTIKEYNNRFEVVSILNFADEIAKQFNELIGEFKSTILLVFLNLLLFLGLRQAFISSLTIPLTFLSTISIMNLLGLSLNFLTMFAFLIALGLLIDDTIVTVAAMTRYFSTGKFTPAETGLFSVERLYCASLVYHYNNYLGFCPITSGYRYHWRVYQIHTYRCDSHNAFFDYHCSFHHYTFNDSCFKAPTPLSC